MRNTSVHVEKMERRNETRNAICFSAFQISGHFSQTNASVARTLHLLLFEESKYMYRVIQKKYLFDSSCISLLESAYQCRNHSMEYHADILAALRPKISA